VRQLIPFALGFALACSHSPAAPTPTPDPPAAVRFSGLWTGTLQTTFRNTPGFQHCCSYAAQITVTSIGNTVTGAWRSDGFGAGTIAGVTNGTDPMTVTVTLTAALPQPDGITCHGTGSFTGTVSATLAALRSPDGFAITDCIGGPTFAFFELSPQP